MAKKSTANVASTEWLDSCKADRGPYKGQVAKSKVIAKWLSEHPEQTGTQEQIAEAISSFSGLKISQGDIASAKQKTSGTSKSTAAPKNGAFGKMAEYVMQELELSKEELIKEVEGFEPNWIAWLIIKCGSKSETLEKLKNWTPHHTEVLDNPWA